MELKTIANSSRIEAVGYSDKTRTLFVLFRGGDAVYSYDGVPKDVYEGLMAAPSTGSFFAQKIVGKYPYERHLP